MTAMEWIRLAAGGFFGVLFVWLSAMNAVVFWKQLVRREHTPSWIPLAGGLFGVVAALLLPYPWIRGCWWLPLLLDPGSVPGLVCTGIWYTRHGSAAGRKKSN